MYDLEVRRLSANEVGLQKLSSDTEFTMILFRQLVTGIFRGGHYIYG